MPELDDQETDKLFQVGAERHDFAYNPDAWAQMEDMLDADEKRGALTRRIVGILALLVIMALALFYYSGVNAQAKGVVNTDTLSQVTPNVQVGTDNEEEPPSLNQEPTNGAREGIASLSPSPEENTERTATAAASNSKGVDASSTAPVAEAKTLLNVRLGENRSGATAATEANEPKTTASKGGAEKRAPGKDQVVDASLSNTEKNIEAGSTQGASPEIAARTVRSNGISLLPRLPLPQQLLSIDDDSFTAGRVSDLSDKAKLLNEETVLAGKPAVKNSLAIGIAAGIVVGRSGNDPFAMVQPRLGLDAEYRIGKKFALGTGVYFNEVCYQASGDNYTVKNEFWTDGVKAEAIQGECDVLEIPLSAKYYFNGSRSNTFYMSAGAITYLMLQEDYTYSYGDSAPADARKGWKERNTNQHFFGMAHFNFGFQKTLANKSALKLETYAHLPLTGIGHGQVRLFSTGVTVKYLFDFRR
jgi:hypothetical protein